jgi:hypothetical protein
LISLTLPNLKQVLELPARRRVLRKSFKSKTPRRTPWTISKDSLIRRESTSQRPSLIRTGNINTKRTLRSINAPESKKSHLFITKFKGECKTVRVL